jgi:thiamine biosynthesis lipoprotein
VKKLFITVLIIIVAVLALVYLRAKNGDSLHEQTRFLMDTYCTIQAYGSGDEVNKALGKAFDRMTEIDRKFNALNPQSPIYAFNKKNIPLTDPEILEIIKTAGEVSDQCNGAFDITMYPLGALWGFYGIDDPDQPDKEFREDSWGPPGVPEKEEIEDCLSRVGYKHLVIENGELRKLKQDVHLDLGAIAKGYALEEAVKVLESAGIESALIDAGGDIYAMGRIEGEGWGIGIRDPREDGVIGIIQASDLAVITSGDYERFFMEDGIRYCHILDPKTGYPAKELISVSIIYADPVLADAWATALFVLGAEKGIKLVEQMPGMETLMVTPGKKILYSSGLGENLTVIEE